MVSKDSEYASTRQAGCQETEMSKCTRAEMDVFVKNTRHGRGLFQKCRNLSGELRGLILMWVTS